MNKLKKINAKTCISIFSRKSYSCWRPTMWRRLSPYGSLFLILQSLFWNASALPTLLTYFEYIRKSRLEKLYQVRYMSLWIHNEYSCMQELYTFRFTNAVACMYKVRQGIHYNNIKCIRYDSFIFGLSILNLRILLLQIYKYFVDLKSQ